MISQLHRRARLPLGPARPAPGLRPQRPRRRLAQPVLRRRPGGVLRVLPRPRSQLSDLRLKVRYQRPQVGDLCIPLGQQPPQPGVRRTQPSHTTGHSRLIRHTPQAATAGPQ